MLVTKEQQEAILSKYSKEHNADECNGFVDGMNAALGLVHKLLVARAATDKVMLIELLKRIEKDGGNEPLDRDS